MPRPLHPDINRFGNHLSSRTNVDDRHIADCRWDGCRNPQWTGEIQLCEYHSLWTHMRVVDQLEGPRVSGPRPGATHVVYYLMLSATTMKIGTTGDLVKRIAGLRTDMQYVVAIEPGSYEVETKRHRAFSSERLGRREDFHVSPRLREHIELLRRTTYSDELCAMYTDLSPNAGGRR